MALIKRLWAALALVLLACAVSLSTGDTMAYRKISAGTSHSVGIAADGNTYAWGSNASGELGTGATGADQGSPVAVTGSHAFVEVAAGANCSFGLKADGSLYAWGEGAYGLLGTGDTSDQTSPTLVTGSHTFTKVAVGTQGFTGYHAAAIDTDGKLWTWGYGGNGEMGNGGTTATNHTPVQVASGTTFTDVFVGYSYTLALDSDGYVWGWGANWYANLGATNYGSEILTAQKIDAVNTYSAVHGTGSTSILLRSDGTIWGYGEKLYLGINQVGEVDTLTQGASTKTWAELYTGYELTFALATDGTWWVFGNDVAGASGLGATGGVMTPQSLTDFETWGVTSVAVGEYHAIAMTDTGLLYASGDNYYGQLGTGDEPTDSLTFSEIGGYFEAYAIPMIFPLFTGAGSGSPSEFAGYGDGDFPGLTGAGVQLNRCAAAADFPSLTGEAQGGFNGNAAAEFPLFASAGYGAGAGTSAFPSLTSSASGFANPLGQGAGDFPPLTGIATTGGRASALFPTLSNSATGQTEVLGSQQSLFPRIRSDAAGTVQQSASHAARFPPLLGNATGSRSGTGAGTGVWPFVATAAAGFSGELATASSTFPLLSASGGGYTVAVGIGAGTFPILSAGSTGTAVGRFDSYVLRYSPPA